MLTERTQIGFPARILHGEDDPDVPWTHGRKVYDGLEGEDVSFTLIKGLLSQNLPKGSGSTFIAIAGYTRFGEGREEPLTQSTYQIADNITWIKGRHTIKSGGQLMHYSQRRFYAGNNGLLGFFAYGGAFTGFPFSDFLLEQVLDEARKRGARTSFKELVLCFEDPT